MIFFLLHTHTSPLASTVSNSKPKQKIEFSSSKGQNGQIVRLHVRGWYCLVWHPQSPESEEADLVEFPVELCWFVVLGLGWILAEEQNQPAVMNVQRVVVSVHLCTKSKERREGIRLQNQTVSKIIWHVKVRVCRQLRALGSKNLLQQRNSKERSITDHE